MNSFISYTNNQKLLLLSYQNFEMVRAYIIQIISRIHCKENKTLKTKEQMTDMDRTEIV
jgi:hypothetical protein